MSKDATGATPGPWEWANEGRALMAPNPEYEPDRYPPWPKRIPILSMPEDYSQPPCDSDAALIAAAPDMAAMLRELEWSGYAVEPIDADTCPLSGCYKPIHHADCRLGRLLEAIGRAP